MDSIAGWKQYKLRSGSYVKEHCCWLASNSAVPAFFHLQEEKAVFCQRKTLGRLGSRLGTTIITNYNKNMKQHVWMESQSSGSNLLKLKLTKLES